jgi:MerR family transcriptional regulator, light-induced transcriptional regulator
MHEAARLRIGELSRRVGVSPALLRAWERRYGLLAPARTRGGLRLYTPEDERRVRDMQAGIRRGLSAAEAARAAIAGDAGGGAQVGLGRQASELGAALDAMDAESAHAAFDAVFATFTLETVLSEVVLPYLHQLGERWASGETSVTQEHFANNLIGARLLALARGWERGAGPIAVLACPPGERHDLALIAFGLALRGRGWRIAFLGADTPVASMDEAAATFRPDLAVLSAVAALGFEDCAEELAVLSREQPVAIAGAGASHELAARLGCDFLDSDPVAAAVAVSEDHRR